MLGNYPLVLSPISGSTKATYERTSVRHIYSDLFTYTHEPSRSRTEFLKNSQILWGRLFPACPVEHDVVGWTSLCSSSSRSFPSAQ